MRDDAEAYHPVTVVLIWKQPGGFHLRKPVFIGSRLDADCYLSRIITDDNVTKVLEEMKSRGGANEVALKRYFTRMNRAAGNDQAMQLYRKWRSAGEHSKDN